MKKMSVWEFKEYCESLSVHRYIFSYENQEWNRIDDTMKIKAEFDSVVISLNPNVICLKSKDNFIRLERVKYVNIEKSIIGDVFTAVCGNSGDKLNDRAYTIIAQ